MKKVDRIRFLLDQDLLPKEIAREVGCALSLVYGVRGRRDLALLKFQVAALREELKGFDERLSVIEGAPADGLKRILARQKGR